MDACTHACVRDANFEKPRSVRRQDGTCGKKILRASLATLVALISFTLVAVIGSHIVLGVHMKLTVHCGNGGMRVTSLLQI